MRFPTFIAASVTAATLATLPLSAQRVARPLPRTADGRPDLQGLWNNGTLTPLQRPKEFEGREFMTEKEAADFEANALERLRAAIEGENKDDLLFAPDLDYTFLDRLKVVDRRTALITDPPDGRMPEPPPAVKERRDRRPKVSYDDPETRPLDERCLLETAAGSSNASPPMVPNGFGQNLYQIVQTPQHVLIYTEVVHDARVIRMNGQHPPASAQFWLGDSIGRWEGDTLVVDTTNFTDKSHWRGSSDRLHVVERFTRVDADTIRYTFTVDDPESWARPWSGAIAFKATADRIFEYACHEGNHAIELGLRGARATEKQSAKP
jgi:hypothetical protein